MMEKNVGIWLDSDKALIVTLLKGSETLKRIESPVDHYHLHGGYGSSKPYSTQDASSETKLNERIRHQRKDYFKTIIKHISGATTIVIYGPAGIKNELAKEMRKLNTFRPKVLDVLSADSMTTNQLRALIREYFRKKQKTT